MSKVSYPLVLSCVLLSCAHVNSSWLSSYEQTPPLKEEPEYETFSVSTEMEIGKAWPILKQAPEGVFISVGAERSFRAASMAQNTTELVIVDISPKVLRFAQINQELLKAKTLFKYRALRFDALVSDWVAMGLTQEDFSWWRENVRNFEEQLFPYPEMLNRFETDTFYQRFKRMGSDKQELAWWQNLTKKEYSCYTEWDKDPGLVFDFASIVDFKTGNYLFDEALYKRLHKLAIQQKIHAVYLDLARSDSVASFVNALRKNDIRVAVLDLDNAYMKEFLGDTRYRQAVEQFLPVGDTNSILLSMVNYQRVACTQYQVYAGFRFDFVQSWFKDFELTPYLKGLPKTVLPLVNGKLYTLKDLPPYWNSFAQTKPSVDFKVY